MRDTSLPIHWNKMSHEKRKQTLESHMFLKEERDGTIKGITVAGGNNQRDFISKEYASTPTVATESVLLTCLVDAEIYRYVTVFDIPNAFIHTHVQHKKDMDIINIRGVLVHILLEIAPDIYESYVTTYCKGLKQIVVQFQNAIYGTTIGKSSVLTDVQE